jgi:hypothetical protein
MSETLKGLEGEYVALAAITAMGWKATHCPMDRIDVLAFLDQTFLRVQVKTASLLGNKDGRSPRHHFQMGHGCKAKHLPTREDYDVLCLVSPNARRCIFIEVGAVQQFSMRLSPTRFTEAAERESWDKAVDYVLEMRR